MKKITNQLAGIRLAITLFISLLVATIGHSQSAYVPDELIIRFKPGTSVGYIDSLRQAYNATEDTSISPSPVSGFHLWKVTQFPAGGNNNLNDINEVNADARGRAKVQNSGLNYNSEIAPFGNDGDPLGFTIDPLMFCQFNFSITCDVGSTVTKVAILDTGIGYEVDEENGHTFNVPTLFDPFYGNYIGYDFVNHDTEPQDDHGHGTHMTGIIAQIGLLAGANTIELESFKTHDDNGQGKIFNVILAVDQSILNRVNIINMSFSYQAPPPVNVVEPLEFVINLAGDNGILVVASAGNESQDNDVVGAPSYPASFTCANIISVASASCNKDLSPYSNFGGQSVDIAALGEDIVSPVNDGIFLTKSGTSPATAITSGVAGLLGTNLSAIHWDPIKCAIMNGAEFNPSFQGMMVTEGIVDAQESYYELIENCGLENRNESIEIDNDDLGFTEAFVYPNPFSNYCIIEYGMKTAGKVNIQVYNGMGQVVFESQEYSEEGRYAFKWQPINNVPKGVYFIQIQTNNGLVTRKVVKQN